MFPAAQSASLTICIGYQQLEKFFLQRVLVWRPKLTSVVTADTYFRVSFCWIHISHASHNMRLWRKAVQRLLYVWVRFSFSPEHTLATAGAAVQPLCSMNVVRAEKVFPFRTVCCEYLIPLSRSLLPYRMLSHLPPQPFVLWFGFTGTARVEPSSTYDILW